MGMKQTCGVCSLAQFCQVREVVGQGFCDNFTRQELKRCVFCGNIIMPNKIIWTDSGPVCEKCINLFGKCPTCKNMNVCEFQSNPNSIPKVVQKQVQTPQGTIVTNVKNPTRIDMFCKVCKCWDKCCNKNENDNLTCGNYTFL